MKGNPESRLGHKVSLLSDFVLLSLLTSEERRVSSLAEMTKLSWLSNIDWNNLRERPSAIPVHIASIDDTSYFDTFPDVQLDISMSTSFTYCKIVYSYIDLQNPGEV